MILVNSVLLQVNHYLKAAEAHKQ